MDCHHYIIVLVNNYRFLLTIAIILLIIILIIIIDQCKNIDYFIYNKWSSILTGTNWRPSSSLIGCNCSTYYCCCCCDLSSSRLSTTIDDNQQQHRYGTSGCLLYTNRYCNHHYLWMDICLVYAFFGISSWVCYLKTF